VNHLISVDRLKNRYSIMRHGQSRANLWDIIVSRIETDACDDYGLSHLGREQVLAAARASGLPPQTRIYSSDFARAMQTAWLVRGYLRSPNVVAAPALRERYFGTFDGTATSNYRQVWAADEAGSAQRDSAYEDNGVESVHAVLGRATALIVDLERQHSGQDILLVSHGDTLQILQSGFARTDPARHRSLPHLETGEIRRMSLAADALPLRS
jgi:probable phosphoglycerate mutase